MATYIDGKLITNISKPLFQQDLTFMVNGTFTAAMAKELVLGDNDYSSIEFHINSGTSIQSLHPYSKEGIGSPSIFLPPSNPLTAGGVPVAEYDSSIYPIMNNPPYQRLYSKFVFKNPPNIIGFYNFNSYSLTGVDIMYRIYK